MTTRADRTPPGRSEATPGRPIDEEGWKAVVGRAETSDGRFVFGVLTTGVYCRPSCPARRPRRENVRWFPAPHDARAAGLRPCRRCDPDGPGPVAARAALVARACEVLDGAEVPMTLATLARHVGVSPHHLHRTFRAALGVTPKAYADARRAQRVPEALRTSPTVTEAVHAAGYEASSRFHADAAARLGMTPGAFRRGAEGERIRVVLATSSLGAVLVAATERGVCGVLLGDDPDALLDDLAERFPRAELTAGDGCFDAWATEVVAMVEHPDADLEVPLDVRGTAFQERVWRALRDLPPGTTTAYGDLAASIGAPTAARGVAAACAANPAAVLVPCHRVVGRDGSLTGYRWGLERKAELLRRERPGTT